MNAPAKLVVPCRHEGCEVIGRADDGYCPKHHGRFVKWGNTDEVHVAGGANLFPPNEGVGVEATQGYKRAYLSGALLRYFNRRLRRDGGN